MQNKTMNKFNINKFYLIITITYFLLDIIINVNCLEYKKDNKNNSKYNGRLLIICIF